MDGIARDAAALGSSVTLAANGDRIAFARLVDAYYADTMRIAFVIAGGDRELAEDAVQAAWSTAWRKLGSLRDPQCLKPWLLAIAANEARQAARTRRRHPVVDLELAIAKASGPDPDALVSEIDLQRCLVHLAPDDRALLALRYVAGFDSSEIATLAHRNASTVRSRLSTLLEGLRKELSDA